MAITSEICGIGFIIEQEIAGNILEGEEMENHYIHDTACIKTVTWRDLEDSTRAYSSKRGTCCDNGYQLLLSLLYTFQKKSYTVDH